MTLTIELPSELQERLARDASHFGMDLDVYALYLLQHSDFNTGWSVEDYRDLTAASLRHASQSCGSEPDLYADA